jgi:hypothetical protein
LAVTALVSLQPADTVPLPRKPARFGRQSPTPVNVPQLIAAAGVAAADDAVTAAAAATICGRHSDCGAYGATHDSAQCCRPGASSIAMGPGPGAATAGATLSDAFLARGPD